MFLCVDYRCSNRFSNSGQTFSVSNHSLTVPNFVMKDFVAIHDKMEILNCFNEHFAAAGSLFESACSVSVKPSTDASVCVGQSSNFVPFSAQAVCRALKELDPRKPSGPDLIDPYFLKLAADFVA